MMIKKEDSAKKWEKRKQVLYGISMDSHSAESLSSELVKFAKLGCQFVEIHVRSDSATALKEKTSIKSSSGSCKCFPNVKQACLSGHVSRRNSIRKVIKRMSKHCSAMSVIVGTNPEKAFGGRLISFTKFRQAISGNCCSSGCMQGKDYLWKAFGYQPEDFKLESWPNFYPINKTSFNSVQTFDEEEEESRDGGKGLKFGNVSVDHDYKEEESLSSISLLLKQLPESTLGWPLLLKIVPVNGEALRKSEGNDASVVPNQSTRVIFQNQIETENSFERDIDNSMLKEQGIERASSQVIQKFKDDLSSISLKQKPESTFGWPLLLRITPVTGEALRKFEARDMSVVQSTRVILQNQIERRNSFERDIDNSMLKEQETERASSQAIQTFEDGSKSPNYENLGLVCEYEEDLSSSFSTKELPQSVLGWPLLQIADSTTLKALRAYEAREASVVQWVMRLPNRSASVTQKTQIVLGSNTTVNPVEREINNNNSSGLPEYSGKLTQELELLLKIKSSGCRWFCYEELKRATSQFSSENLIGEGGCSSVYKGYLPSGKPVAVKILKSYKEAWNDFSLEVDIVSSLKHKHITPLIGVCVGDNYLISVYEFLPKGSLEESLHGNKEKSVLPWDMRFKVAVVIAEALNYLHNECSQPVIHRDVKSSNILLSAEFQPQLSDFGLAIWGPKDSTYMIHGDVVGTFGYIAPEYFMHGRVSDKIDVYSFGVVLLELLSGKRPIGSETLKVQESLVKWAKPLIDSGDLRALLDPNLEGHYDIDQMHRMVLAASHCINQSARLRPKASQILQLLRGEKDCEEWIKSHVNDLQESVNQEDDELYPEFGSKPNLDFSFALLNADNDASSSSNAEQNRHFSLEDYLKGRHSL